jgi:hypothetical protein
VCRSRRVADLVIEPPDDFLGRFAHVARLDTPSFAPAELPDERPLVVVPAAP